MEKKEIVENVADGVAKLSLEDPWELLKKQVREHPIPTDTELWLQRNVQDKKNACLLMLDLLQAKGCALLPKVLTNKYDIHLQWGSLPRVVFLLYYESYRADYHPDKSHQYVNRFFPVSGGGEVVAEFILKYVPMTRQ